MAAVAMLLWGCASKPPAPHAPVFATKPYEPFSAAHVVAIARREWRLFGEPVDDDPPGTRAVLPAADKPERQDGLWQRVGEYWFAGQDTGAPEAGWTGKHDADGVEFGGDNDGQYAWSAAFVSYVMRIAGAGAGFPYAANHATYIDIAVRRARGEATNALVSAERPTAYAPRPGDLICMGRGAAAGMSFDDLPAGKIYPAHCDIVVETQATTLAAIGGNVDDAVTLKHVPIAADGKLAGPDGLIVDTRYPWFVILRILYPA